MINENPKSQLQKIEDLLASDEHNFLAIDTDSIRRLLKEANAKGNTSDIIIKCFDLVQNDKRPIDVILTELYLLLECLTEIPTTLIPELLTSIRVAISVVDDSQTEEEQQQTFFGLKSIPIIFHLITPDIQQELKRDVLHYTMLPAIPIGLREFLFSMLPQLDATINEINRAEKSLQQTDPIYTISAETGDEIIQLEMPLTDEEENKTY
jgi:hypothetical protein